MRNPACGKNCSVRILRAEQQVPDEPTGIEYDDELRESYCPGGATPTEENGQLVAQCNSYMTPPAIRAIHVPLLRAAVELDAGEIKA